jgi:hypothetical protein
MGATHGDTVTTQGKKRMSRFMTNFLNSNKRPPEISTPHDPLHPTHVGPDQSTDKFIGLPKDWQQLLEYSGISKSDQEKVVMPIINFHLEGGGDVSGGMTETQGPCDSCHSRKIRSVLFCLVAISNGPHHSHGLLTLSSLDLGLRLLTDLSSIEQMPHFAEIRPSSMPTLQTGRVRLHFLFSYRRDTSWLTKLSCPRARWPARRFWWRGAALSSRKAR